MITRFYVILVPAYLHLCSWKWLVKSTLHCDFSQSWNLQFCIATQVYHWFGAFYNYQGCTRLATHSESKYIDLFCNQNVSVTYENIVYITWKHFIR